MSKPTDLPTWATDGGTRTEPPSGQKAAGYAVSTRPPAKWMNYLIGDMGDWVVYLYNRLVTLGVTLWSEITPAVAKNLDLKGVAYNGSDLWSAVGEGDGAEPYILTSPDRLIWTERDMAAAKVNRQLNAVGYNGSDLWAAVGGDGVDCLIVTSPDGDTTDWVERVHPSNEMLNDVAHNGTNLWVAVGVSDGVNAYILTSPDGITWTEQSPTVDKDLDLNGVTYGDGIFVAVGEKDGAEPYILTSSDGLTWTERDMVAAKKNIDLNAVAYNGVDLFVATGDADGGDALILTSPDGVTDWTERANPKNFNLYSVVFDGVSIWIAGGNADGTDAYLITSLDGLIWTERDNPQNSHIYSIAVDEKGYITAVGQTDGANSYILNAGPPIGL